MPEDLPGRGVHHDRLRAGGPEDLEERELAARVDVEVEERLRHRLDVADLTGEVEDHVGPSGGVTYGVDVADIGFDHGDASCRAVEVVRVRAVRRYARIHHGDLGVPFGEREREVRADKAQPAGDEAATVGERREQRWVQSQASLVSGPLRAGAETHMCSSASLTAHHQPH